MNTNLEVSNIQSNHTMCEYRRYFSTQLYKGKLKRYSLNEVNKLNPKRMYWKITDEKGDTYYYETPKYIKPGSNKDAYSVRRVMHRKPAKFSLLIFAATAFLCFTSSILGKTTFKEPFPEVTDTEKELQEKLTKYLDWANKNPGGDATKAFSNSDLGNIAIAQTLFTKDSPTNEEGYYYRPFLAVGHGATDTDAVITTVHVDISNCFIGQKDEALEESISFSASSLPAVPKVGRRDFYKVNEDKLSGTVTSNPGVASSPTIIKWNDKDDKDPISKEDYIKEVGKMPNSPFLYTINEDSVLEDSSSTKTSDGYVIKLNLDTTLGVGGYVKRIKYLSDKNVTKFNHVNLTITTDKDLKIITNEVDESYYVDYVLYTSGKLKTKFYYTDVPKVPNKTTPFDYSKYPA